jgi:glycosyltransferase involved in cell wall biosynthesis
MLQIPAKHASVVNEHALLQRPLRVLHIIPTLTGGGAENFLCALASQFDEGSIDVGLMSIYPTDLPEGNQQRFSSSLIRIERSGRYDLRFFWRMARKIREFRPDVVHAHLHNGKYWGRLAALIARVPIVIFTEHSPLGEKRIFPERIVDWFVNRVSDCIIVFTEDQRELLLHSEGIPSRKIVLIENGIPLPPEPTLQKRLHARRLLQAAENEFVILVLGRLEPIKNQQLALRAMQHLPDSTRERIRMFIIGGGTQEGPLRALAVSLGIADRIKFTGHCNDPIELLYGGDVLYMPSLVEGIPLAVLEAMSVGLPVICSPWTGAHNLLENGRLGIILSDWDPQSAARAFANAIDAPQILLTLSERARSRARSRYDIKRIARLHEALYRDLARRKNITGRAHAHE